MQFGLSQMYTLALLVLLLLTYGHGIKHINWLLVVVSILNKLVMGLTRMSRTMLCSRRVDSVSARAAIVGISDKVTIINYLIVHVILITHL